MTSYGVRTAVPAAGGTYREGKVKGTAPRGDASYVQPLTQQQRKRTRAILVKSHR